MSLNCDKMFVWGTSCKSKANTKIVDMFPVSLSNVLLVIKYV